MCVPSTLQILYYSYGQTEKINFIIAELLIQDFDMLNINNFVTAD